MFTREIRGQTGMILKEIRSSAKKALTRIASPEK